MLPPSSIVREALQQARLNQPGPGRILRLRVNGRLTTCCPDCSAPLVGGVCRECDNQPALNPTLRCTDCHRVPMARQTDRWCSACGGRLALSGVSVRIPDHV